MKDRIILLIEDNPDDVRLTARRAFKERRISNELVAMNDGVEALNYLFNTNASGESANELPSVILLDLKLPKMDGLEVLRRLRANERTRRLPVVILTSSKEEQDLLRSYDLGANSYIRKPVDFEQFADAIQELGLYWLVLNEPPPPSRGMV